MLTFKYKLDTHRFFYDIIKLGIINDRCWLAGGAFRTLINPEEPVADYDLFFRSYLDAVAASLKLEEAGYETIFNCPQGLLRTFKKGDIKIQVISNDYYNDINHLLNTFDITACRAAYDGEKIYTFFSTYRDIKNKQLRLHIVTHPAATLKRMTKYAVKGYKVTKQAVDKFIEFVYEAGREETKIDTRFYID